MNNPTVSVILSTYNGARYLPEMLSSLEKQSVRPDLVIWRDDGSLDQTGEIVRLWSARSGIALKTLSGPNLGAARSFLTAIAAADPADVTMLADQDDVWLPSKIERAVAALQTEPASTPALYATRLAVVDRNLTPLRQTSVPHRPGFSSAACESLLTGCTMAFNLGLARLLRTLPSGDVAMHDWWIYLVAAGTGKIIFDEEPTILYRQHETNVIGASASGFKGLFDRLATLRNGPANILSGQLSLLLNAHGHRLKPRALALARQLVEGRTSPTARWRAAFSAPIHRQSMLNRMTTRVAILTNRF